MGIGASKRVEEALISSPVFAAACESVYEDCLAEAQHAFAGVRPYQLGDAADRLHAALSHSLPLVRRWVPLPPPRQEVDKAFCRVAGASADALHLPEFKAFATELFRAAIMAGAGAAVARRIPIGDRRCWGGG
ncbi:hypothetical protein HPP92_004098 [Vanilla planifolia]|uniref:Uncharacterized protein n=1 Tax=Vanilla planifolia TaxID=51239 RepID=A0A835VP92_VANPL|nr:hypothetical protein HPP92_004533 [Vanilla planifolia]KAG0504026.1 hypothetical protein HPP92_004098 [Vanilla planifolia]